MLNRSEKTTNHAGEKGLDLKTNDLYELISDTISSTSKYLEDAIIYDRNDNDITQDFTQLLAELQNALVNSATSITAFNQYRAVANKVSLFCMATIYYPDDKINLLKNMHNLINHLNSYSSHCEPTEAKTVKPAHSALFQSHTADSAETGEDKNLSHEASLSRPY